MRIGLLGFLAACRPAPDVEPLPCRNPEAGLAELGKGDLDTGFIALEDGDEIEVVFGPQGMHMIVVSARIVDFEAAGAGGTGTDVSVAIRYGGEILGGTVGQLEPSLETEDGVEFLGIRAVFTVSEIEPFDGVPAEVEMVVVDGCGREISAERTLVLAL